MSHASNNICLIERSRLKFEYLLHGKSIILKLFPAFNWQVFSFQCRTPFILSFLKGSKWSLFYYDSREKSACLNYEAQ